MYLTYEQYQEYGGSLDNTLFNEIEFEAETLINWYTFNRLINDTEFSESVKRCVFKLIKLICIKSKMTDPYTAENSTEESTTETVSTPVETFIQSQSNDGVSISYNVLTASEILENSKKEIENCCKLYLSNAYNSKGLKLTYRGMYPNEEHLHLKKGEYLG